MEVLEIEPFGSEESPCIHRFYDTSPLSPCGKFLAVTKLPFDDREVSVGTFAYILVCEVTTKSIVYRRKTLAWDTQVGAHVQWGKDNTELFFNDMLEDEWEPFGVKVNIFSGSEEVYRIPIYMVSEDGEHAVTPDLKKLSIAQLGYGVNIPKEKVIANNGWREDDGIFYLNTKASESKLLVSFASIYKAISSDLGPGLSSGGGAYGFHVKFNKDASKIMFIVRWLKQGGTQRDTKNFIVTLDLDGNNIALALHHDDWIGGHHPNWMPDGEKILMNLVYPSPRSLKVRFFQVLKKLLLRLSIKANFKSCRLSFVAFGFDGSGKTKLSEKLGSGHPSLHPHKAILITDSYLSEHPSTKLGYAPIRYLNLKTDSETVLVRTFIKPIFKGVANEYRVDPHPAWSRCGNFITFNTFEGGRRSVRLLKIGF